MRIVCARRRSSCSSTTGYDEDAVDERRLVPESSGPARRLVAEEDFAEEFGFAGEVELDRCRRAGEGVAEDGFFHCGRW